MFSKAKKRIVAITAALTLVAVVAIGTVGAAGFGTFALNLTGDGAQQGAATITGACQEGVGLDLEFSNNWVPAANAFQVTDINIAGMNVACTVGTLVVNGATPVDFVNTAGTAMVAITPVDIGDMESLAILLQE